MRYFPNYINAHLVHIWAQREQIQRILKNKNVDFPGDILEHSETASIFREIEKEVIKLHELGYREMPEEMYRQWLESLKEKQEKTD